MAKKNTNIAIRNLKKAADGYICPEGRAIIDAKARADEAARVAGLLLSGKEFTASPQAEKQKAANVAFNAFCGADFATLAGSACEYGISEMRNKAAKKAAEDALIAVYERFGFRCGADFVADDFTAIYSAVGMATVDDKGYKFRRVKGERVSVSTSYGITYRAKAESAIFRAARAEILGTMTRGLARDIDGAYTWPIYVYGEDARYYAAVARDALKAGDYEAAEKAAEQAADAKLFCENQAADAALMLHDMKEKNAKNTDLMKAAADAAAVAQAAKKAAEDARKAAEDAAKQAEEASRRRADVDKAEQYFTLCEMQYNEKAAAEQAAAENAKQKKQAAEDAKQAGKAAKQAEKAAGYAVTRAQAAKDTAAKAHDILQAAAMKRGDVKQAAKEEADARKAAEDAAKQAEKAEKAAAQAEAAEKAAEQAYKATGADEAAEKAAEQAVNKWNKAIEQAKQAAEDAAQTARAARAAIVKARKAAEQAEKAETAAEQKTA